MPLKVKRTFKGETSRIGDQREELWNYDVHSDNLSFTVNQAKYASDGVTSIPAKGAIHPEDGDMVCIDVSASRDQDLPTLIRVAVQWRTPSAGQGESGGPEGGTTQIWNVELAFDHEEYSLPRLIDLDGVKIATVIGELVTGCEQKKSDSIYVYTYYVKNANWILLGESHGAVNNADVILKFNGRTKTFPKYTLQVLIRKSVVQTYEEVTGTGSGATTTQHMIWKVEYRIIHKVETHFTKVENRGFYYLDSFGKWKQFMTNNQPAAEPRLLAADGTALPEGVAPVLSPVTPPTSDYPGFRLINLINFATLPGFGG